MRINAGHSTACVAPDQSCSEGATTIAQAQSQRETTRPQYQHIFGVERQGTHRGQQMHTIMAVSTDQYHMRVPVGLAVAAVIALRMGMGKSVGE